MDVLYSPKYLPAVRPLPTNGLRQQRVADVSKPYKAANLLDERRCRHKSMPGKRQSEVKNEAMACAENELVPPVITTRVL